MANTQNQRQIPANGADDASEAQENQPNYFDTLPDELHLEILKKVSQLELDYLALACRRFNSIIEDRRLWKKVVIVNRDLEPCDIGKLMRRPVQHLSLYKLRLPSPLFQPALATRQPSWCLKEVCLHHVETYCHDLVKMFNKCTQLRKVDLERISVNNDVFVALSKNKNIEILRMHSLRGVQSAGLGIVLRNAKKLQEFYIQDYFYMRNLESPLIINSICENLATSLLHLTLGFYFDLTDQHVAQIVRNCPLLQSLSVIFAIGLTGRSTESLRNLKHFRILNMEMCRGIPLAAYLPLTEMKSLVELNIKYNNREKHREIEELFGVTIIEDHGYWRVGSFKTRFGKVVRLTY